MFMFQKMADEGASTPYIARVSLGILKLRDAAIQARFEFNNREPMRLKFDKCYTPIWNAMDATRSSAKEVLRLIPEHKQKIATGQIVKRGKNSLSISESIDKQLREAAESFLRNGLNAMKSMQNATELFGVRVGCLFMQPKKYENGITELKKQGFNDLADFLETTRKTWSESFVHRRNSLEHEGWNLPKVTYQIQSESVTVIEPQIDNLSVSSYVVLFSNRLCSFVENIFAYTFQFAMKDSLWVLSEIPVNNRPAICPERFETAIRGFHSSEWHLTYSEDTFLP